MRHGTNDCERKFLEASCQIIQVRCFLWSNCATKRSQWYCSSQTPNATNYRWIYYLSKFEYSCLLLLSPPVLKGYCPESWCGQLIDRIRESKLISREVNGTETGGSTHLHQTYKPARLLFKTKRKANKIREKFGEPKEQEIVLESYISISKTVKTV